MKITPGWWAFHELVAFALYGPDKALPKWIENRPKGRVCGLGWQDAA